MKRNEISKKLVLNKKTVSDLNINELKQVVGGYSVETYCNTDCRTNCASNCVTCQPTTTRLCG